MVCILALACIKLNITLLFSNRSVAATFPKACNLPEIEGGRSGGSSLQQQKKNIGLHFYFSLVYRAIDGLCDKPPQYTKLEEQSRWVQKMIVYLVMVK